MPQIGKSKDLELDEGQLDLVRTAVMFVRIVHPSCSTTFVLNSHLVFTCVAALYIVLLHRNQRLRAIDNKKLMLTVNIMNQIP